MDHEDIERRLRNIGRQPIDARTRREHLERIAAVPTTDDNRRRGYVWAGIAAAAVTGFLVGSAGLAMADALPNRAQTVAHDVLGAVQVDVPQGKEGKRGPCVSEAAKIKDKDAKKAAKDACPKGDESGTAGDDESDDANAQSDAASSVENDTPKDHAPQGQGQDKHAGDPCHGRPPWAGPMSKEDRAAAKAANSRDACPDDEGDASDSAEAADTEHSDTETADVDDTADTETAQVAEVATTTTTTTTLAPAGDTASATP